MTMEPSQRIGIRTLLLVMVVFALAASLFVPNGERLEKKIIGTWKWIPDEEEPFHPEVWYSFASDGTFTRRELAAIGGERAYGKFKVEGSQVLLTFEKEETLSSERHDVVNRFVELRCAIDASGSLLMVVIKDVGASSSKLGTKVQSSYLRRNSEITF